MAYDSNNLSALSYANGFTLWHYKTPDHPETVELSYYFDKAANMLRVGDFIFVNGDGEGAVLLVRENRNGHVTTIIMSSSDRYYVD